MLHIIGDIDLTEGYFDKGLGIGNSLVDKKEDPFEYLSRRDDDLWIGNFECVCSDVQATGSPFIINPCHLESHPPFRLLRHREQPCHAVWR